MKRIKAVDMVRVEIEYGEELENYEERFYSVEKLDKLEDVIKNIFEELKNDFLEYPIDEVEYGVYGLVDTESTLLGKCYDQTFEDSWEEYEKLKPWF